MQPKKVRETELPISASTDEQPTIQSASDSDGSASAGGGANESQSDWNREDLQAIADQVYELLLRDLLLERERGAW